MLLNVEMSRSVPIEPMCLSSHSMNPPIRRDFTKVSKGAVFIFGHDCSRNIAAVRELVGYCPQTNCVQEDLTVAETLHVFARLKRGASLTGISREVRKVLDDLDLRKYQNREIVWGTAFSLIL
jgi:ABC-type Na+ transport system ATPase subunit NatA